MRVAAQATEGAANVKSHAKPALRAMPAVRVQISLPVQGVLRDVRHAFPGLCIDAGRKVLAAMTQADRVALCGPKGVPDAGRRAVRGVVGRGGGPCGLVRGAEESRLTLKVSERCRQAAAAPGRGGIA